VFTLSVDRKQSVLMVKFSSRMTQEDLNQLDTAVVAFVKKEGATRGFLIDCTDVEDLAVPTGVFVRRGQRSANVVSDQERVYVMPQPDLFGMGRMFGTYQRMVGKKEPLVVKTLLEAFEALGLSDPLFEPVPLCPAT
jgi:hypothetical protein